MIGATTGYKQVTYFQKLSKQCFKFRFMKLYCDFLSLGGRFPNLSKAPLNGGFLKSKKASTSEELLSKLTFQGTMIESSCAF